MDPSFSVETPPDSTITEPVDTKIIEESETVNKASILSSSFNLANTVLGAGILTLPYNLMNCGWFLGIFFLALVGVSSALSFYLLTIAGNATEMYQYRDIARALYRPWFSQLVAVMVAIYTLGTIGSYSIVLRDNMFWWAEDTPANASNKRGMLWAMVCFIVFPLSLLPRIDFLNFTSLVAIASILYIIFVVIGFFFLTTFDKTKYIAKGPPQAFNWSINALTSFPLFTTAFCGHYNSLNVFKELNNRSIKRMNTVIAITVIVTSVFNSTMALFGYFAFTDLLHSDILENIAEIPGASVIFYIANTAMILVMLFSYPLLCYGLRGTIESMFYSPDQKVPYKWRFVIIMINVFLPAIVATFVDSIADILSFTSSLCGSPMVFIFPGMFGYSVTKRYGGPKHRYVSSLIIIVLGIFYTIAGFGSAIYSVVVR